MYRWLGLLLTILIFPQIVCIACAPSPPPVINNFTANPSSITSGDCAALNWNVTGATSVTLQPGTGTVSPASSMQVCPSSTTTYTLTASNPSGSANGMAIITVTPRIPQTPNIIAGAVIPQRSIRLGQLFNLGVIIFNIGSVAANNAHLKAVANPGGLIAVLNIDQPYSPIAPSGVDVNLGDLYPGNQRSVNFTLRAPTWSMIGNRYGQNFAINFTIDSYNSPSTPVGTINFAAMGPGGGGGVMMYVDGEGSAEITTSGFGR